MIEEKKLYFIFRSEKRECFHADELSRETDLYISYKYCCNPDGLVALSGSFLAILIHNKHTERKKRENKSGSDKWTGTYTHARERVNTCACTQIYIHA